MLEWDENDFRIFVGDMGNEVNDDVLTKAFAKYSSVLKCRIVRDKRSNKSKGAYQGLEPDCVLGVQCTLNVCEVLCAARAEQAYRVRHASCSGFALWRFNLHCVCSPSTHALS